MPESISYADLELAFNECSKGAGEPDCLITNLGFVRKVFPKTPWLPEMAEFPDSTAIMVSGGLTNVIDGAH